MTELLRMTTDYQALDDRIRVVGETKSQEVIVLWLTQRLLIRLLPHMLEWLEKQTLSEIRPADANEQTKEVLQVFKQQSARAEMSKTASTEPAKAAPVKTKADSRSVLVESIDIRKPGQTIQLIFKGQDDFRVGIVLSAQQLRQWLAIIRAQWESAAWPLAVWPNWITKSLTNKSTGTGQGIH